LTKKANENLEDDTPLLVEWYLQQMEAGDEKLTEAQMFHQLEAEGVYWCSFGRHWASEEIEYFLIIHSRKRREKRGAIHSCCRGECSTELMQTMAMRLNMACFRVIGHDEHCPERGEIVSIFHLLNQEGELVPVPEWVVNRFKPNFETIATQHAEMLREEHLSALFED
jgi:hypothetical protein